MNNSNKQNMKNISLINNNISKSPYNLPFTFKGINKSNYLYMQLKNNSNNNQKQNISLNSQKSKSKSKQKNPYDKNSNKIINIKASNKRISQSQNNKNLNLDYSFHMNNNIRNNSEKINNNKNIRESSFLGYSKNQKQMRQIRPIKPKNNIISIKGINLINGKINFGPKTVNDIFIKTNINKSERNKTPNIKNKDNANNLFKINPSDYSMILSNSSLNGNNIPQNNLNSKINIRINKYGNTNYNNINSIKNKSKIRTKSDYNIFHNRQSKFNRKAFEPKNIFNKFKRKKTSNISHGFGYNNILVNNNNNYIYFGSLLEENKNSSRSVNSVNKAKEEKEKININKSQTQNSIRTNDTSGLQINVNSNLLSLGNISNYNIHNHYNQSLNVDCHEINLSLLGKNINEISENKNTDLKVEKIWKGKNIKCIHDLSKTGLAGDEKKVNQDNYFIFKNFVQGFENIYMGVCDGHGYFGHEVSGFIKENLPMNMNHALKKKKLNLLKDDLSQAIKECFIKENQNLLSNHQIDSDLSGTTCISVIYTPQKLIIANIGDSRCVLGKFDKKSNKFISENLSRDHKPTIPEEAERILKVGGRIRPMRDEDGEYIGPLRVYMKDKEMPGLAMTRSFGDYFGSTAGTISEPEVTEHVFKEEDKFIILASDGLFEFIESEEVVKYVGEYYKKNDIVGCCEFLYKESCKRWLDEEEDTIDDITIIIVFFEDKYD